MKTWGNCVVLDLQKKALVGPLDSSTRRIERSRRIGRRNKPCCSTEANHPTISECIIDDGRILVGGAESDMIKSLATASSFAATSKENAQKNFDLSLQFFLEPMQFI